MNIMYLYGSYSFVLEWKQNNCSLARLKPYIQQAGTWPEGNEKINKNKTKMLIKTILLKQK